MSTIRDFETKIFNRINPAVKFSVTRYVLAVGVFVAIVVFGIISLLGLGVDQLPTINIPVVIVSTLDPGATPAVIDQSITQVIENTVTTISGITDISSSSQTGSSIVAIFFDQSTDKNSDANQVASQVSAAIKLLPPGVNAPTVKTFDPNSAAVVQIGITGKGVGLDDVSDYVTNDLLPNLERVNGVANITEDGAPQRQFQVLLNPDKLRFYSLTPQNISAAITSSEINTSIGTINHKRNVLTFSTVDMPTDPVAISKLLVDSSRGIKVGDVASVRDTSSIDSYARINGTPMVLVDIQKTTDANTVAVVHDVEKLMATTRLPKGYSYVVGYDSTGPITASINNTYHELFITSIVVAFIVLLFLGKLNTALSVILAIPIALSAAPIIYKLSGFTLNLVSLLALISAIGIVVDDSIVVAENVERYRAMGFGLKVSVLKGASEVFSAVVAASLSLLSVLIPVSFMGGFVGRYIQQFALGLAAAVAFSLFEALLFLTVRLAYTPEAKVFDWNDFAQSFGKVRESFKWGLAHWRKGFFMIAGIAVLAVLVLTRHYVFLPAMLLYPLALGVLYYLGRVFLTFFQALTMTLHGWTETFIDWVRDAYARSLSGVLKWSVWVLAGSGVFVVLTVVFIAPHIPFNFVPQADNGFMVVNMTLPVGTPIDVTNGVAGKLEAYIRQQPEVRTTQTVVSSTNLFSGARYTYRSTLTMTLKPVGQRGNIFVLMPRYRQDLLDIVHREFPSGRVQVSAGGGFAGSSALPVNITSVNFARLQAQDAAVIQAIQQNRWVTDVSSSLSDTSLENDFYPNPSKLQGTGLVPASVGTAMQIATSGFQASSVQIGGESYPINVMVDPVYLADGQSLLNLPIYSPTLQTNLQMGQLGSFTLNQVPTSMTRYNRIYYAQYTINLTPDAPPQLTVQDQLAKELQAKGVFKGDMQLTANSSTGPAALARQLQTQAPITFLLALFLVYLVMGAQFNSWRYPIYLLLPVPLALIGALFVVFLKGGGLDVFGLLGMLMLIGLSAKNAILYLDFVVERLGKMPFEEALIESGRLRFRPIVMTTLTVLVTSFPLIFGGGQGAEFGQGLGIVTFGGIIFSAVLTFFVVPAAFYLFERRHQVNLEKAKEEIEEAAAEVRSGELPEDYHPLVSEPHNPHRIDVESGLHRDDSGKARKADGLPEPASGGGATDAGEGEKPERAAESTRQSIRRQDEEPEKEYDL
jgi:HAE1 family hydrophobic/amphiphilic exporter-1